MRSIIVIGHARSGTSLTAGILAQLGVNMGDNWRMADEANEKGYFENSRFVEENQKIIEQGDIDKDRMKALYDEYKSELWGAKDPRFVETWQYWEDIIENPMFIVCKRDKESVISSVLYRDNGRYSKEKCREDVEKTLFKNDILIKALRKKGHPMLYVKYENYFDGSMQNQVKAIADFIGVKYEPVDLIDINLKHF